MSFLSFLGFGKMVEDGVKAFEPPTAQPQPAPAAPKVKPKPLPEYKEHYRVGRTTDGMTTLTLIVDGGYSSTTLTMNQEACEQMIRMLQATFDVKKEESNEQPNP